ncbi:type II secretion system protein N [Ramlibacter tataouinensis]
MVSQSRGGRQSPWAVRGATFALWALAAGSAAYWGLKLSAGDGAAGIAAAVRPAPVAPDPAAIARLLGASPQPAAGPVAAPSLASRFSLVGVAAGGPRGGAALIAVDGKPARPYRVGTTIEEGLVVQSVQGRQAVLAASADGPPVLTLEMPPLRR